MGTEARVPRGTAQGKVQGSAKRCSGDPRGRADLAGGAGQSLALARPGVARSNSLFLPLSSYSPKPKPIMDQKPAKVCLAAPSSRLGELGGCPFLRRVVLSILCTPTPSISSTLFIDAAQHSTHGQIDPCFSLGYFCSFHDFRHVSEQFSRGAARSVRRRYNRNAATAIHCLVASMLQIYGMRL